MNTEMLTHSMNVSVPIPALYLFTPTLIRPRYAISQKEIVRTTNMIPENATWSSPTSLMAGNSDTRQKELPHGYICPTEY